MNLRQIASWPVVLFIGLILGGCNTIYDDMYFARHEEYPDIPECDFGNLVAPTTFRELFAWRQQHETKCTAELLRRRLARDLASDASPRELQRRLEVDGFSCERASGARHADVVCLLERRAKLRSPLLPVASRWRHLWRVTMRDVTPVVPTVIVTLSDLEDGATSK